MATGAFNRIPIPTKITILCSTISTQDEGLSGALLSTWADPQLADVMVLVLAVFYPSTGPRVEDPAADTGKLGVWAGKVTTVMEGDWSRRLAD